MPKEDTHNWNKNWSELAITHSPDPIIWISIDGNIIKTNLAFDHLFYIDGDQQSDHTIFELDENLSKKDWKEICAELLSSKMTAKETVLINNKGQQVFAELVYSLIENVIHVLIRDVSERKKLEAKIEESNLVLERIVNERSEG